MIDNDDEQPSYDQFIDEMRLPFVFGNQYAVAAASKCTQGTNSSNTLPEYRSLPGSIRTIQR